MDGIAGVAALDLDWFLAATGERPAIPSAADRPDQRRRALEYPGRTRQAEDPTFDVILNARLGRRALLRGLS
jgi:hypothetical protein